MNSAMIRRQCKKCGNNGNRVNRKNGLCIICQPTKFAVGDRVQHATVGGFIGTIVSIINPYSPAHYHVKFDGIDELKVQVETSLMGVN